jgi:hypothetical protein
MHKRVGLLAGLLVLALGTEGVARSPSPTGPEAGVRLGVPEAKVALTIPAGWNVSVDYRPAAPPPGQSMPVDERWAVLVANDDSDRPSGCRLMRYPTGGLTLLDFASGLLEPEHTTMTPMRLDAGDAIRLDLDLDLDLGDGYVAQQYVIGSDDSFYQLACLTEGEVADDRWLSIAETFEFLPEEE